MKRDITIWIALAMVVIPWAIGGAMGMPRELDSDDPLLFHVIFWIMLVGAIRMTIFWFQTLIHCVKFAREENRVATVLGHIFLGPVMAYGNYFTSRREARQAEPIALTKLADMPAEH